MVFLWAFSDAGLLKSVKHKVRKPAVLFSRKCLTIVNLITIKKQVARFYIIWHGHSHKQLQALLNDTGSRRSESTMRKGRFLASHHSVRGVTACRVSGQSCKCSAFTIVYILSYTYAYIYIYVKMNKIINL